MTAPASCPAVLPTPPLSGPQTDNTKLLRAITTMRSRYSVDDLERRHAEESVLVNRISNFRGPETAR